ncbi:glycosyltransferase [Christensenellaceae bacterium OttesenSCG-928-M15]|nr:glycosyltransferase [Christensenellaceae bacterium OttesenSCG-928-M15]
MAPRFSICVPVRNGAEYLPHTLRLCVEQQYFDDYEIVVSDNQSSEDIKTIVESFHCDAMRYVRTPGFIGMGANFDFALDNAIGEYKLIIGSDDGISRFALYILDHIIRITGEKLIMWNRSEYYWPNHHWMQNKICMYHNRGQGLMRGEDLLRSYLVNFSGEPPHIYDSAVIHTNLIAETEERTGQKLHHSFLADFYQAMTTAMVAKRYVKLKFPLSLYAERAGTAASTIENSLTKEYQERRHSKDELAKMDAKLISERCIFHNQSHFYIQKNLILCQVLDMFSDELQSSDCKLNNEKAIYNMLDEYAYRASISESLDEFRAGLEQLWDDVRDSGDDELINWFKRAFIQDRNDAHFVNRMRNYFDNDKKSVYQFIMDCDNFSVENVYDAMLLWDKVNFTKEKLDTFVSDYEYAWKRAGEVCSVIRNAISEGGKLGIYGAARNGVRLCRILRYFIPDIAFDLVLFDKNSNIHGRNLIPEVSSTILPPDRIPLEGLDAIVTCIYRYDEEIYRTIRDYDKSVKIIRLFERDEVNWMVALSDG